MNRDCFWLTKERFARLRPLLPTDTRGKPRVDDRRVISGIVHVLKSGGRRVDDPRAFQAPDEAERLSSQQPILSCGEGRQGPEYSRPGTDLEAFGGWHERFDRQGLSFPPADPGGGPCAAGRAGAGASARAPAGLRRALRNRRRCRGAGELLRLVRDVGAPAPRQQGSAPAQFHRRHAPGDLGVPHRIRDHHLDRRARRFRRRAGGNRARNRSMARSSSAPCASTSPKTPACRRRCCPDSTPTACA